MKGNRVHVWEWQTAGAGVRSALAASGAIPENLSSRESGVGGQRKELRPGLRPGL